MSASIAAAELAAGIVNSLNASGIAALPDLDEDGRAWIALVLDEHTGVVAWLDVQEGMTYAVLVHQDGRRTLDPRGPLHDLVPCDSAPCVSAQVLSWVLSIRCGANR